MITYVPIRNKRTCQDFKKRLLNVPKIYESHEESHIWLRMYHNSVSDTDLPQHNVHKRQPLWKYHCWRTGPFNLGYSVCWRQTVWNYFICTGISDVDFKMNNDSANNDQHLMGLLPDTQTCGMRMRWECRELFLATDFKQNCLLAILACITACWDS